MSNIEHLSFWAFWITVYLPVRAGAHLSLASAAASEMDQAPYNNLYQHC